MKIRLWMNLSFLCLGALLCGCLITAFLVQYDDAFKNVVEQQVKYIFFHAFKSSLEGTVKRVNIFTGEIELEHVTVLPTNHDDSWSWKAKHFVIQFSWLSYVVRGKFDVFVRLDELVSHSQVVNSYPVIIDHLQSFIAGAEGFPATLKSLAISRGAFTLHDRSRTITITTLFNGSYGTVHDMLYFHLMLEQGELMLGQQKICDSLSGSFHCSVADLKKGIFDAVVNGTLHLGHELTGKNICSFDGQWHNQQGQFFMNTSDSKYAFSLYNWQKNDRAVSGDVRCTIPLAYCASFFSSLHSCSLEGDGEMQLHVTIDDDYGCSGQVTARDVAVCGKKIGTFRFEGTLAQKCIQGTMNHLTHDQIDDDFKGSLYYKGATQEAHISLQLDPQDPINLPLALKVHKGSLAITMQNHRLAGSYHWNCSHEALKDPFEITGDLTSDENGMALHGDCGPKKFDVSITTEPFSLRECKIYEKSECPLLDIKQADGNSRGIIDIQLLKEMSSTFFNYKIPGQGIFEIDVHYTEHEPLTMHLILKEGNIRVPGTYTLIRSFKSSCIFDYAHTMLEIQNGVIELDKGQIECKRGIVHFNERGVVQSAYIPIVFKKAFLTLYKEVFAVVSGYLLLAVTGQQNPLLQGNLSIDRSYCKKNIFSQLTGSANVGLPFITNMLSTDFNDLVVDLAVETKKPLEVKTSFLETQVQINVAVHGSLQNPELAGSVNLVQGVLAFPYRPLHITHGMIYFLPHQLYDPTIELIAKGKVRKYQITLRCNGSLQHPSISFESTPPLTEEQIITLLLAGTEEGSLSLAMPALVVQKMQNVIFGPEQSALKLEGYFKSLLEPLKHIRFIPGFSDQSGRGGFRGSIEVDVNDQLRAMIQKNFSLTEDIKYEVEYFFSDDITFRGIRDERADFGAEVEMRWKF